jgi:predicted O-methyltransferase YrrM
MENGTLAFWDRLLPNQDYLRSHYKGPQEEYTRRMLDRIFSASDLSMPEQEFDLALSDKFSVEAMGSDPINLRLYEILLGLMGAKRVLEIGTFIGVSTMCLARALGPGGKVVTIEKWDHFAGLARENFTRNGFDDSIELLEGDAFTLIGELEGRERFDFIFLDANKERYPEYFERLEPLLAPKGLFVIDDVFFHGDLMNDEPISEKGRGARDSILAAAARKDFQRVLLPLCNGVLLLLRR